MIDVNYHGMQWANENSSMFTKIIFHHRIMLELFLLKSNVPEFFESSKMYFSNTFLKIVHCIPWVNYN